MLPGIVGRVRVLGLSGFRVSGFGTLGVGSLRVWGLGYLWRVSFEVRGPVLKHLVSAVTGRRVIRYMMRGLQDGRLLFVYKVGAYGV